MDVFTSSVSGFIDTLKLFKVSHPGQTSYSQKSLFESIVGEKYAVHDTIEDVTALKKLVNTAGISADSKYKQAYTVHYAQQCFSCKEMCSNLQSLQILVAEKVITNNVVKAIAGGGLQYKHLLLAYTRNGWEGIEGILQEKYKGSSKVRVTRSKKIIYSISEFIARHKSK